MSSRNPRGSRAAPLDESASEDEKEPGSSPVAEDESVGDRLVRLWRKAGSQVEQDEVFRQIFEQYRLAVFRFFKRRGCARQQAEDLAQDTFLRVYKNLEDFRRESRFATWLFQIAVNVYRNMVRDQCAQKRDAPESSLDSAEDISWNLAISLTDDEQPQPLVYLLTEEKRRLLREAIQELPPQMRRCVLMRVEGGMKYRDIADVLGISVDTVKAHLFQAKQKLKAKLSDYFTDLDF
jgi:RNA polymerase sigma-70 factor (ECF subfamily)